MTRRRVRASDPASAIVRPVDENYQRMRARLLAALADHESGDLDHAGLQAAVENLRGCLGSSHRAVQQALFEADVALEAGQHGRVIEGSDPDAPLRRMRRNLREVLK
jgi:hypothetical protein